MGRQVNFICSEKDIIKIFDFVNNHNASFYSIFYLKRIINTLENVSGLIEPQQNQEYSICLNEYYNKLLEKDVLFDLTKAEAIQFSKDEYINGLFYCRIWAEFGFWKNDNDANSYTYKSEDFEEFYNALARFIKKGSLVEKSKIFWFTSDAYCICKEKNFKLYCPTARRVQLELPR
jgi:hypothetical protein